MSSTPHNPLALIESCLAEGSLCGATRIITIDGRAGSGKTTLASDLSLHLGRLGRVELIHLDDIYDGWEEALGAKLTLSLEGIVDCLKNQSPVSLSIYNWSAGKFDEKRTFDPPDILIIEGVGSGQRVMREAVALSVWMDVSAGIGLQRVLDRDGQQFSDQMRKWQTREEEHFATENTRENADFIFMTE